MKTIILIGLCLAMVAGGAYGLLSVRNAMRNVQEAAPQRHVQSMPVYPPEAADLPETSLSDLVAAVTPTGGFEQLGWDHLIDNPLFHWETNGLAQDARATFRCGLVRVRVDGRVSTIIRRSREEIAWVVTLGTYGSEKFGPKWIDIDVGGRSENQCFGPLYDGCTFTLAQALAYPGMISKKICGDAEFGSEKEAYLIQVPGKAPALLVYSHSEGSGGASSSLEIRPPVDLGNACAPI